MRYRPRFAMHPAEAAVQAAIDRPLYGDLSSWSGAERLRQRIEDYWRQRGRAMAVSVVRKGAVSTNPVYGLVSVSLNGYPL